MSPSALVAMWAMIFRFCVMSAPTARVERKRNRGRPGGRQRRRGPTKRKRERGGSTLLEHLRWVKPRLSGSTTGRCRTSRCCDREDRAKRAEGPDVLHDLFPPCPPFTTPSHKPL